MVRRRRVSRWAKSVRPGTKSTKASGSRTRRARSSGPSSGSAPAGSSLAMRRDRTWGSIRRLLSLRRRSPSQRTGATGEDSMPQNVVRHEGEHLYADQPSTPEGRLLSEAVLHLRRAEQLQAERAQRASGLSHIDLTALRYLVQGYRDGRDLSPKDLIIMLDTSSATVTNVVERLVQRGFITRVQHPRDRRAHYLVPTEEAVRRVDDSLAPHHSAVVGAIEGLS